MHLYLQTVRTGGHGGDHHRLHQIGLAGGVAGVYHDGQMGLFVDDGHSGKIQRIAGVFFKGADAALAEDDLFVAAGHDVLGAHDPLLDGVAQAALEQHGLVHFAHGLEQLEVLHIACADLHHVHILLKLRDAVLAHQLGDDGQAGGFAGLYHIQNALGLQPLKGVGRGAGLVGTAAEQRCAARLDPLRDAQSLLGVFDAAGARHDGDLFLAADLHAAAVDDRVCGVEQAVCALIGRRHAGDVVDPRVCQHVPLVDLGGVAHQTEHVVVLAGDQGHVQTLLFEFVNDLFQLFFGSAFFGGDDHGRSFLSCLFYITICALLEPSVRSSCASQMQACR